MNTLVQQFAARGVEVSAEGPAIVAERIPPEVLHEAVSACEHERPVDTFALAANVRNKFEEKWDHYLDEATLCASLASRTFARNPPIGFIVGHTDMSA